MLIVGCNQTLSEQPSQPEEIEVPTLDEAKATNLYHFAYECIDQEYPNKTGHTVANADDLMTPSQMHPAFYGCFDWHSAVHVHWTLVNILILFPDFEFREAIIEKLMNHLTAENILQEEAYFQTEHNATFERTYGWVWLLKLAEALHQWDAPEARIMEQNLQPLTDLIETKLIEFLPKLTYPIRVGEHPNTAFALSFAYDYAVTLEKTAMKDVLFQRAMDYYQSDKTCPVNWEPGGFDFLSPCLQEAALMAKMMDKESYKTWINDFMPELVTSPDGWLMPAKSSDRSDGKLSHLDGLNFSRAWCLYEMGKALDDPALIKTANEHFEYSYGEINSDHYAGAHWLASFALYALKKAQD